MESNYSIHQDIPLYELESRLSSSGSIIMFIEIMRDILFRKLENNWGCRCQLDRDVMRNMMSIRIRCHEFLVPSIQTVLSDIVGDPTNPALYDIGDAPSAFNSSYSRGGAVPNEPRYEMAGTALGGFIDTPMQIDPDTIEAMRSGSIEEAADTMTTIGESGISAADAVANMRRVFGTLPGTDRYELHEEAPKDKSTHNTVRDNKRKLVLT